VSQIRIVVADDHAILLDGLKRLLEPKYQIVAVVSDGRAAVEVARELRPEIVLLDISMPLLNGIEAARRIRQEVPESKVIILTMYTDRHYVRAAIHAGVSGYVLKHAASEDLLACMERVLEGGVYITPGLAPAASTDETSVTLNEDLFGRKLTPRQRDVLQLVAEGKSAKDIAHVLNISVKTVEFHKASIFSSLGLRSTAELTRYAVQQGIVTS